MLLSAKMPKFVVDPREVQARKMKEAEAAIKVDTENQLGKITLQLVMVANSCMLCFL